MVARSHPPVVFGAGAVQPDPDKTIIDADLERLKARSGAWHVTGSGSSLPCLRSNFYRAARFHTDIKPAVDVSARKSKPVIGADFDLLTQVHFLPA